MVAAILPLGAIAQSADVDRQVAVTVDDLPATALFFEQVPPPDCDSTLLRDLTGRLLDQFSGLPATGFVNEGARICDDLRITLLPELLRAWLNAGHDLASHTFSHRAFENIGRQEFELDVVRGESTSARLLSERGERLRYFRYPFLHAPADSSAKAAFETFLSERGYTVAPVTLDGDEWIYAWAYSKAIGRADTAVAQQVGGDYVRYMEEIFAFNETFSRELLGRELPQILLIHANHLNADYFDELRVMIERRGYRFVSLEEAMADEAYSRADPYVGERGLSWLQRLAVGIEGQTRREPRSPEWVREIAERNN
jgi:peptidoglycan/xylan/chitin deacetylase (PgdA/CDA1 family)